MKTPEQMAIRYADLRGFVDRRLDYKAKILLEQGFLAGYQAAKDQLADASNVMCNTTLKEIEAVDTGEMMSITNSVTPGKWISVKDRLPEPNISVLVRFRKRIALAAINIKKDEFIQHGQYTFWKALKLNKDDMYEAYPWNEITHWMPLPEAPKEEE